MSYDPGKQANPTEATVARPVPSATQPLNPAHTAGSSYYRSTDGSPLCVVCLRNGQNTPFRDLTPRHMNQIAMSGIRYRL